MRSDLTTTLTRTTAILALAVGGAVLSASCLSATEAPEDAAEEEGVDGPEPTGDRGDAVASGNVADAAASSCSTGSIKGLSLQIIEEGKCMEPDAYVEVPKVANISFGDNVFPYLEKPARDHLVQALSASPSKTLSVNSMLRTVAQQYLLYRWYQLGRCGISLAAKPGNSNHETGLAFDTSDYSTWRSALEAQGFKWLGSSDKPHFDYAGAGAKNYKGVDVEAFQRLWNRNNPNDKIDEDGAWGPQTEARMKKAPAQGFPIGAQCNQPAPGPSPAACAHDVCEEGAGLDSTCDACATKVCAADAYCCETAWDNVCVGQVASACGKTCDSGGQPAACGAYTGKTSFTCAPDGMGRGKCSNDALVFESCPRGCLINDGAADDVCMGTSSNWSCSGTWGTKKVSNGDYYITAFGCWEDANGTPHSDPGDNCIPSCLSTAQQSICSGMSGPECERHVNWFAADAGRFGCMARLRVTNPANGKAAVVVALDLGPNCSVENSVSHGIVDLSYPVNNYLFGEPMGAVDHGLIHVVEVDPSTPLGPVQ